MAQSIAINPTAIYSFAKPTNFVNLFLKKFRRRLHTSCYSLRTSLPFYSTSNFDHINPRSAFSICYDIRNKQPGFSSYIVLHNFRDCDTRRAVSSIGSKELSGPATEPPLKGEAEMTVTVAPYVKDGVLFVNGKSVLSDVPSNVVVRKVFDGLSSPDIAAPRAAFIGASSSVLSSRHVFSLGVFQECKHVCLFRYKIWWMIPRFGSLGKDIPIETQMLLLEVNKESSVCDNGSSGQPSGNPFYMLFLPVLEGQFRATLQGTPVNELELCIESGDDQVQTDKVAEAVFINYGDNPFELIRESFKILEKCKGTFTNIEHKKKPAHLDWFGWCTWDAFYKEVNPVGIKDGLESFLEGGCPPKFLIIDDGWQDTFNEFQKDGEPFVEGSQFASRLVDLKESARFMASGVDISCHNLHDLVKFIRQNYGVKFVYVWHALIGYWGGLLPSSENMKKYNPKITYPIQSPGNVGNSRDIAMDSLEKYGVGLMDPEKAYEFYNDLHRYLSSSDVDGVKVDVQNLAETLGAGYGGRVSLTRHLQHALEESVARNFKENNLISCMSLNNEFVYSSKHSASARASEDFMPREPLYQTVHVASVAFNSLLLGEIVVPDWDMFQSNHYTADFHGVARALGGCAVYVSDKPGMHDFKLLKRLVLPDGSILRARYAGRPTRDCLFIDTVMDRKSLLKIWNLNKYSGVVGIFNCQGAGCWPLMDVPVQNPNSSPEPLVLSGHVSPLDVDFLEEVADENCNGECVVFAFHTGSICRVPKEGRVEVSLGTLECEVFTISPIRVLNESLHFAPIGLIDMYNGGGSTQGFSLSELQNGVRIKAWGSGRYGAYSSEKPISCRVDGEEQEFEYDSGNGLLITKLKLEAECSKLRDINFCY